MESLDLQEINFERMQVNAVRWNFYRVRFSVPAVMVRNRGRRPETINANRRKWSWTHQMMIDYVETLLKHRVDLGLH